MITITCIVITWYLTKVYYTRSLTIKTNDSLKERGLAEAKCSQCCDVIVTKEENLRNPFYCSLCK